MTGFQAPNYTQVPNDYFDLIMEMTEAEIKILSVLIRSTFGYHRDEIQVSVRELATATKMSTSSVWIGAEKLEDRGLIERSVSKSNTVTNWRVVISDTKLYRQIVKTVSNDSEEKHTLPLKKEKKEIKLREREEKPLSLDFSNMSQKEASEVPTLALFKQATDFFPGSPIWQYVHETIELHSLTVDRIKAANEAWCAQDFKRGNVRGILEWAVNGIPPQYELRKPFTPVQQRAPTAKVTEPKAFEAIRRWQASQEVINGESTGYIEGNSTP